MPRKKSVAAPEPAIEEDGGIEALELQKAVVARIARAAIPDDVKLQKEVPTALQKASTVFISYLAALSHDTATERNHKTINATHVLDAAKQLGWEDGDELHKVLKKELAAFRAANEDRKAGRVPPKPAPAAASSSKGKAPATSAAATAAATAAEETASVAMAVEGESEPAAPTTAEEGEPSTVGPGDAANVEEEEAEAVFPEPEEEEDNAAFEEYVDEGGEDEEMDEAGSEGVEEEIGERGLEDEGEQGV
ncbi:hypothetical protein JCM11641_006691 [Rhodosporidiobolus odoratus]